MYMKILKFPYLHLLFLCFFITTSCVSEVDFDQAENISPTPVLEASLIVSNLEASNFIDDTNQQELLSISDVVRLNFINSDFFVDQLVKANLTFQFTNSLNRDFNVDFIFVTDANEQRYLAQVEVLAGSPDSPTFIESNFLIEEPDLSLFVESTRLIYEITLPPTNTPIAPSTLGVLKLESKSTFYFEF